jgi:hypothetical protein
MIASVAAAKIEDGIPADDLAEDVTPDLRLDG